MRFALLLLSSSACQIIMLRRSVKILVAMVERVPVEVLGFINSVVGICEVVVVVEGGKVVESKSKHNQR